MSDALRSVSIADGVVTRPASSWSATVHAFLRYLRAQGLTCVPEPIVVEGNVERLVAIEGASGAEGPGVVACGGRGGAAADLGR